MERESIDSQQVSKLVKTTYVSECDCGRYMAGSAQYDRLDGTLYGDIDCPACGAEFIVDSWFEECDDCGEYHPEGECEE